MASGNEQFEAMLYRAWRGIMDAVEVSENQGRVFHTRKLKRAAVLINEIQGDVLDSSFHGALKRGQANELRRRADSRILND